MDVCVCAACATNVERIEREKDFANIVSGWRTCSGAPVRRFQKRKTKKKAYTIYLLFLLCLFVRCMNYYYGCF